MITPPYLRQGQRVAVVAPSRFVIPDEIEPAIRLIESWGLEVVRGKSLYRRWNQFAGTDQERAADLQGMLDDTSVKAILFARGGYGAVRIIDKIDFRPFTKHPKWIAGYSDITVFFQHIEKNCGIEVLHAPMLINFDGSNEALSSFETLRKAVFGEPLGYNIDPQPFSRPGVADAPLTGGNLSLLCSLSNSTSEAGTEGKILFFEEVDEYHYHVDRMIQQLKRSGKLSKLAGLIVGGMEKIHDNTVPFGSTTNQIIYEAVKEYNFPVLIGFPAGHTLLNSTLILGRKVSMQVGQKAMITFMEAEEEIQSDTCNKD
ncbi:MAG TPA: LD-carboxypeptidase [Bacteroidales bacterium]|nr:LD-carboxypeptidase [Bacteroidales bacterium]